MLIKLIERSLVYPRPSRERGDWRPKWLRPQNVWFRSADNTKKLQAMGLEPAADGLAATEAYIKSEIKKWAYVVQAAKITAE